MKRSKTLLVSNIFATAYSVYLLWVFGSAIIAAGGIDYINVIRAYFKLVFEILGVSSPSVIFLYVILILLCIHIFTFIFGCFMGWIAYIRKKSGIAKFSASLYLIGTMCFPLYLLVGLPMVILGFIGGARQKKLNI